MLFLQNSRGRNRVSFDSNVIRYLGIRELHLFQKERGYVFPFDFSIGGFLPKVCYLQGTIMCLR